MNTRDHSFLMIGVTFAYLWIGAFWLASEVSVWWLLLLVPAVGILWLARSLSSRYTTIDNYLRRFL